MASPSADARQLGFCAGERDGRLSLGEVLQKVLPAHRRQACGRPPCPQTSGEIGIHETDQVGILRVIGLNIELPNHATFSIQVFDHSFQRFDGGISGLGEITT